MMIVVRLVKILNFFLEKAQTRSLQQRQAEKGHFRFQVVISKLILAEGI